MKQFLKLRAEDYNIYEIRRQEVIRSKLLNQIKEYISNPHGYGLFIIGPRGEGKTFYALRAIADFIAEKQSFSPLIYTFDFQGNSKLINFNERNLNSGPENLEGRPKYDCLVINDYHNNLENVERGEASLEESLSYLYAADNFIENGKPVIILSEEPLNAYASTFAERELPGYEKFDELITRFGQYNPSKLIEYRDRIKFYGTIEIPGFDFFEAISFANLAGLKVTNEVVSLRFNNHVIKKGFYDIFFNLSFSRNPRSLLKLRNALPYEELDLDKLKLLISSNLEDIKRPKFVKRILDDILNNSKSKEIYINYRYLEKLNRLVTSSYDLLDYVLVLLDFSLTDIFYKRQRLKLI